MTNFLSHLTETTKLFSHISSIDQIHNAAVLSVQQVVKQARLARTGRAAATWLHTCLLLQSRHNTEGGKGSHAFKIKQRIIS